ncbi:MAG TPA: hypothetical protein PL110_12260 [Candidatus Eremiobacteraeota bacterium]|nr:hypothetical protein [Candidatus Eremiobacteraeota bacterium]
MEQGKNDQEKKPKKFDEKLTMKIKIGQLAQQTPAGLNQTTSSILSSIKPLPPGLLKEKKYVPEKIENKPAVDLYNIAKMPVTPPIKTKKKDKEEKGKTEQDSKERLIPLQLQTSLSGQSLMYQKAHVKSDIQTDKRQQEKTAKQLTINTSSEKACQSMSLLKYISVSVKCRRIIYEKGNLYSLIKEIDTILSDNKGDMNKVEEKLKDFKNTLNDEIKKIKENKFPPETDNNFKEAKTILLQAISIFIEGFEDIETALSEKDYSLLDNARDVIDEAFIEMEKYFKLRDEIKAQLM